MRARLSGWYTDRRRVITQAVIATALIIAHPHTGGVWADLLLVIGAILATDAGWIVSLNRGDHDSCDTHIEWLEAELERVGEGTHAACNEKIRTLEKTVMSQQNEIDQLRGDLQNAHVDCAA